MTVCSIWKGHVIGGGVGLSFKNRFRIATETASFNLPETHIYFSSDASALSLMPTFNPANLPRALFIALTMTRITGEDIVRNGLATHFVPIERVE